MTRAARSSPASRPTSSCSRSSPTCSGWSTPGIVSADWNQNQYKGIVTNSVVTLMVRPGNPKHITSFDDLAKPDVDVIDPNPATSGGARWNIMAIYGSQIAEGKSPAGGPGVRQAGPGQHLGSGLERP